MIYICTVSSRTEVTLAVARHIDNLRSHLLAMRVAHSGTWLWPERPGNNTYPSSAHPGDHERHHSYHLSCEEFDDLCERADSQCEICQSRSFSLTVDHDHSLGRRAIRGLVCQSCNNRLGYVDAGIRPPTVDEFRYLAAPWHAKISTDQLTCPESCTVRSHGSEVEGCPSAGPASTERPGYDS